ncbi:MAG TPA: hypothetical protein VF493_17525, partial [Terriglobales bacterium]
MEHFERGKLMRRLITIGVFLALLTAIAEAKSEPYFSLSADRTFLPGEKIKIHLYANSVDALEFRVYKISDPTAFFEQLNDVHGFGEYTQKEQIDKPTAIERFHDWKRSMWIDIRDFFRQQFSTHSRSEIRETSGRARKSTVVNAAVFAQVPILNTKQLVARWKQELPPRYFSQAQDLPLDSLKKGVYVVEATDGTLRAYTLVIISEMAVITKTAPSQLLAFTANRRSGAPVGNAEVVLWSDKKQISKLATDRNGLTQAVLSQGAYEETRVIASHEDDVAIVAPYRFNLSSDPS